MDELGSTSAYLLSEKSALEPHDATYWKDFIDDNWTSSNGTYVDAGDQNLKRYIKIK